MNQQRRFLLRIPWTALATLTMPPDYGELTRSNVIRQSRAWSLLSKRFRRQYRGFGYAFYREAYPERLHMHVLLKGVRIDEGKLGVIAQECSFGERSALSTIGPGYMPLYDGVAYTIKSLGRIDVPWPAETRRFGTSVRRSSKPVPKSNWFFVGNPIT